MNVYRVYVRFKQYCYKINRNSVIIYLHLERVLVGGRFHNAQLCVLSTARGRIQILDVYTYPTICRTFLTAATCNRQLIQCIVQ